MNRVLRMFLRICLVTGTVICVVAAAIITAVARASISRG